LNEDRKVEATTYPNSNVCMMTSGRLIFNLQNLVMSFQQYENKVESFSEMEGSSNGLL
jgi:hypothetical protein